MKKKIAILMAAMLVVSAAGCGQKTTENTAAEQNTNTAQTDVSENYGTADYTPDQIDMKKVDGDELKSSSDKKDYSGELGDVEVTIEDAKVIDYDGVPVAIVSFKYKNNGSTPAPFTGKLNVQAYQDDSRLASLVVTGVEGVTMLALSENVEKGDTITVQTAYRLNDTSTPLDIEVSEFDAANATSDGLVKTFEF